MPFFHPFLPPGTPWRAVLVLEFGTLPLYPDPMQEVARYLWDGNRPVRLVPAIPDDPPGCLRDEGESLNIAALLLFRACLADPARTGDPVRFLLHATRDLCALSLLEDRTVVLPRLADIPLPCPGGFAPETRIWPVFPRHVLPSSSHEVIRLKTEAERLARQGGAGSSHPLLVEERQTCPF